MQQQQHTSTTGPTTKHTQVQQKLSNESIDLSCSSHSQQSKNEHIVWPKQTVKSTVNEAKHNQNHNHTICNYVKRLLLDIVILALRYTNYMDYYCTCESSAIHNRAHTKHSLRISLGQMILNQSVFMMAQLTDEMKAFFLNDLLFFSWIFQPKITATKSIDRIKTIAILNRY